MLKLIAITKKTTVSSGHTIVRFACTLALSTLLISPAFAAECRTDLNPTDSYRELSQALACLQQRIQTLEQRSAAPSAAPPSAANRPAAFAPSEQTLEADRVRFALAGCTKRSSAVTCRIQINPIGADSNITIQNETFFADNVGKQSKLSTLRVNGKDFEMTRTGSVRNDFVADIPVLYEFTAEGISPDATQIAALKIYFSNQRSRGSSVTFKGINLN